MYCEWIKKSCKYPHILKACRNKTEELKNCILCLKEFQKEGKTHAK
jgi:hypothetical protein